MSRTTRALLIGALALTAAPAWGERVTVTVVDVAGEVAYVTPGRAAGLVPGTQLELRGETFVVVEATETTAVVKLDKTRLAIGTTGSANVTPGATAATKRLPPPRPPEAFAGKWAAPVLPATTQDPDTVALGSGRTPGRAHLTVLARGYGAATRDRVDGDVEARVIGSFDLMSDRPLSADVDVAGRAFRNGYDARTHTPVFVRAAQLRYGDAVDPRFALGRLRYAASSLGMLDGGRASLHAGALGVAAFGGLVPDPASGKPDTSVARFGAEVSYDAPTAPWQPRVALTAHGSTWDGAIDEQRASLVASASHGPAWLDGWAEAQAFPSDNPWGASSVELTGAGASAQLRQRGRYVAVDFAYQEEERSRRLAAAFPLEWLCTPTTEIGDASATCADHAWWTSATAAAGLRAQRFSIDAVGSLGHSHGTYTGLDSSAYLRGEYRLGLWRVQGGAAAGKASFASWNAVELGLGYAPSRTIDLAARYRPELLDYTASTGPVLLHSLVGDAHYALSASVDLAASAIATVGSDRDALAVLATIAWRPLP